jgi:hypothetical protein
MARLAGAPHRVRPTHPKRRARGEDVPRLEAQNLEAHNLKAQGSAPEAANRRGPQPIRGLGLRLVVRIARAAGRLVIVR